MIYFTLALYREKAAKIKLQAQQKVQEPNTTHTSPNTNNSPLQSNQELTTNIITHDVNNKAKISEVVVNQSLHQPTLNPEEYPMLLTQQNKENTTLPFSNFSPCSTVVSATSYAQMVNRNPKRTLVDRCLSPTDGLPHKRAVTSDIMTTPTEYKSFSHYTTSPSCDTTPEATRSDIESDSVCIIYLCLLYLYISTMLSLMLVCVCVCVLQSFCEGRTCTKEVIWNTDPGAVNKVYTIYDLTHYSPVITRMYEYSLNVYSIYIVSLCYVCISGHRPQSSKNH